MAFGSRSPSHCHVVKDLLFDDKCVVQALIFCITTDYLYHSGVQVKLAEIPILT